ncbi:hypothetical protein Csa_006514 [Cucumis sativus]|uniref:Uncharacterized protein n=1 Tax=Cucumis sativus TaxID=3659 RepID=A0A0A0LNY4_CUCSA|nr:hypothetical protein Csa_006514 [Cucumis sativus]
MADTHTSTKVEEDVGTTIADAVSDIDKNVKKNASRKHWQTLSMAHVDEWLLSIQAYDERRMSVRI